MAAALILAGCTIPLGGPEPRERPAPATQQPTGTLIQDGAWVRDDATDAQRRADIDSCYNYAYGAVERTERIRSDSRAARDTGADLRGYSDLEQRVLADSAERRVGTLFTGCMRDKGYYRSEATD